MSPRNTLAAFRYPTAMFAAVALGLILALFSGQAALRSGGGGNIFTNSATFGTPTAAANSSATAPATGTITRAFLDIVRIQCDVAVYLYVPGTASALNGELLFAGDTWTVVLPADDASISYLPFSGTANCTSWKVVAP